MDKDIIILDCGSVIQLQGMTSEGLNWLVDNLELEPWQWLGNSVGIDQRYADDIIIGAQDAGLVVSCE